MAGSHKDFKFYPRCKRLNLNHISFADCPMLFCKGDGTSYKILSQCLELFAASSGLYENTSKSIIFLAGIPNSMKSHIA